MKYDAPDFLEFSSSVSVTDFQSVLRLQRVITLRHSIAFQCNLVNEQTTLSPTSCSQRIYDLFLSFLHNFGFSKKMAFCRLHYEYWAVSLESLRLDTLSNTVLPAVFPNALFNLCSFVPTTP